MTRPKDPNGSAEDREREGGGEADPVARRIQELRAERGWSLAELAERAGLRAPSHIFHIEAGEKIPSEEVAVRLADALGADREVFRAWARLRGRSDLRTALSAARTLDASLREEAVRAIVQDPHHEVSLPEPEVLRVEWPRRVAEPRAMEMRQADLLYERSAEPEEVREGGLDADALPAPSYAAMERAAQPDRPSARAKPSVSRIPLLLEGVDPEGPEGRECPAAILRFQRGVLEAHPKVAERLGELEDPFAYLLSRESTARTRGFLPPGYVAILARPTFPLEPGEAYAVRLDGRIEIGQVRWDGRRLLLLPSPGEADFAVLRAPNERAVARRLAGKVAILVPPEAVRAD